MLQDETRLSDAELAAYVRGYITDPSFPEDRADAAPFLAAADRLNVLDRIRMVLESDSLSPNSRDTAAAILALLDGKK